MKALFIAVASALLVGCASITMDDNQVIKVETYTAAGQEVPGADCKFQNKYFPAETKSGESARIHRSNDDLSVKCQASGLPDANGTAISRANAGLAGNILFGGGIGAIIDHSSGKAYSYPTWMRLIFGENRVYDRNKDKEGAVHLGEVTGAVTSTSLQVASVPQTVVQRPLETAPVSPVVSPLPSTVDPVPVSSFQPTNVAAEKSSASPQVNERRARLEDSNALPYVGARAKQGYAEWLTKPYPRAFALSERGHWAAAWGDNPADAGQAKDPTERALAVCSGQTGVRCKLYAVDDAVVWK